MTTSVSGELAHIGKTIFIRGDVSANEDIYVDGQVEGSILLNGNVLTVGPNGRVHANVAAKSVVVSGTVEGNIQVSERTEMRKTAVVTGDVETRRISIEDGAYFKGKLEILDESRPHTAPGVAAVAASTTPSPSRPSTSEPNK
jgi:cytoskeletal protein CcmA (bactofilin family)